MSASSCGHAITPSGAVSAASGTHAACQTPDRPQTPPGRSTGPWPCQSVTSASSAAGGSAVSGAGAAAPRPRRAAPGCAPPAAGRPARRRPARRHRADARAGRPAATVGPARRARRGRRAAGRGAGQRLGHAALQHVLEQRQHLGAQPHPLEAPGRRCAGRPTASGRARRRPRAVVARRTRAAAAGSGRRRGAHAGDRARPGAAAQPEQHRLGLVVEGVAEQHAGVARRGRPRRARRSGRRGRRPPGRPARPTSTGDDLDRVEPELVAELRRPARACSAEPACSPWSTVTSPAGTPARAAPRTRPRRPARASRRRRSRRRAPAPALGDRGADRASGRPATAGPRSRSTAAAPISRGRGRSSAAGRRSRPWSAASRGDVQIALKPSSADLVDDGAHERRAVDVLAGLGVQAEQPAQQPVERVAAACAGAARSGLSIDRLARDDRRRHRVHHVLGVTLDQRHERGEPVEDRALLGRGEHGQQPGAVALAADHLDQLADRVAAAAARSASGRCRSRR